MLPSMRPFLIRWLTTTLAVFAASLVVSGLDGTVLSFFGAGLLLTLLNAAVRPALLALSLPLIVRSLGLFYLVLNAVLLKLVGWIVPGFHVEGIGGALWGSIWIGLASWGFNLWLNNQARIQIVTRRDIPDSVEPPLAHDTSEMKTVKGRVIEP